jgi:CheY-like chemotaxis protein
VAVTSTNEPDVRVLLVGDSGVLAPTVRRCLERAGCEVVACDDVGPALALVDAFMPDVVLVQRALPSGTAFDMLGAVRSDPRCAGTGVVLVMEDVRSAELLNALDLGADDFLCVPFTPVELLARVQAVLRRRALVTPVRVAEARLAAARTSSDAPGGAGPFRRRPDATPWSGASVPAGVASSFPPRAGTVTAPPRTADAGAGSPAAGPGEVPPAGRGEVVDVGERPGDDAVAEAGTRPAGRAGPGGAPTGGGGAGERDARASGAGGHEGDRPARGAEMDGAGPAPGGDRGVPLQAPPAGD